MTKKRKFLIVSHGALAGGMRSSVELIAGSAGGLQVLQAYMEGSEPVEAGLARLFKEEGVEWVVFTDLLGGSITNQVVRAGKDKPVYIVAGCNLPLVMEVMLADAGTPVEEVLVQAIAMAREQLVYVNALLTQPDNDA
jgi:fructoselysine and glucoselysine-specific PTS system IIA component